MTRPGLDIELDAWRGGAAQTTDTELQELLTVEEVAALLKVSKDWVYEHTRSQGTSRADRLPHIKVGKYVRFDPQSLRTFLSRRLRTT